MTDTATTDVADADLAEAHASDDHHPTPKQYVQVAVVLGVLTGMEISASFVALPKWVFLSTLIILMLLKFALVAGWFMHLKFDTRVYTRFMLTGLAGAASLYAIVLLIFRGVGQG